MWNAMATSVTTFLSQPIRKKLIEAVNFGYKNSKGKYSEKLERVECIIILALFCSFLKRDLAFYYILQDIISKIDGIKYSDLSWWLCSNFNFDNDDVSSVLSFANELAQKGELKLPQQVLTVFIDLQCRYSGITVSEATKYFNNKEERRLDKTNFSNQVLNQRTKDLLIKPIFTKILESVMFARKHEISKYPLDFNLEQNMVLTLFYGLLRRDVAVCVIIQDMLSKTKVNYSHLFNWLSHNFDFDRDDCKCVGMFAGYLLLEGVLNQSNYHLFDELFYKEFSGGWINLVEVHSSHSRLLRYKIKENARDEGKTTALHIAASLGDASAVHLLCQYYPTIEPRDRNGSTPLHEAVKGLHFETVRVLLELGVNSKIEDKEGLTPVGIAQHKKSQAMLKLFHNYSKSSVMNLRSTNPDLASINKRDKEGRTVLHILAGYGLSEEVRRCLQLGAHSNLRDKKGKTPLHYAIRNGNQETVYLLSSGSDITRIDFTTTAQNNSSITILDKDLIVDII